MNSQREKQIISFFEESRAKFSQKDVLNQEDIEYLFMSGIDLLNTTYPSQILLKYFLQPDIVKLVLFKLNDSGLSSIENRKIIQPNLSGLIKKFPKLSRSRFVKFRILDKYGNYPNCDLSRDGIYYSNINQVPTLQTINHYSSEQEYTNYSEVSWVTRKELQAAICISLAPDSGKPLIYYTDFNHIEINEENLNNVPKELRSYFLLELIQFQNRFKSPNSSCFDREALQDVAAYNFVDIANSSSVFHQLVDNFSIRNHLLLRTSNYLLKSSMLWENRSFGEEAIVNIFFAIEGCLHLIQKKYGDNNTRLNRKLLKKVFVEKIHNGENLYSFIEDGYYKRISLVHAEPDWGAQWSPFLMADDFYDCRNVCMKLLKFILIDKEIE